MAPNLLVVILGPKTRLAKSLMNSTEWASRPDFVLVARGAEEAERLGNEFPAAAVHRPWERELATRAERIAIVCCAFGVIHKGEPVLPRDAQAALRDRQTVQSVVEANRDATIHVLLVSSALALSPRPERDHYAGWKSVLQAWLRQVSRRAGKVQTSILYPGRLVEQRGLGDALYTSYSGLARRLIVLAEGTRGTEQVLGLDARLWLLLRSLSLVRTGFIGRR